jgi:hypothetical protein
MRPIKPFIAAFSLFIVVSVLPRAAWAVDTAKKAGTDVNTAVKRLEAAKASQDKWETRKAALISEYVRLTRLKEGLDQEHKALLGHKASQKALNRDLVSQKAESLRILKELPLFLEAVTKRIEALVASDAPFLKAERKGRIHSLKQALADPAVTLAEKYRKVMEALFIEAAYGDTIEVYQEKIALEHGQSPLVDVFRLGRVSLFFLSLDQKRCGVYTPSQKLWQTLDPEYLPAVKAAVEIGSKRRPAELLPLPLGRLAPEGGAS